MPTYHIEMMEGRTVEQKKKLVQEITRITVEVLGGSPESVDILITDSGIDADTRVPFEDAGIELIVVEPVAGNTQTRVAGEQG